MVAAACLLRTLETAVEHAVEMDGKFRAINSPQW